MLSIILSVSRECQPVRIQATLVISYYSCVVIEGTTPGVGQGKELLLLVEDGVHLNPIARGLVQTARSPLHIDWVQKELDTLEKAGVITRSVSLWASPIIIVPKRTALREPPKKRICVDYRVINSLLPKVNKAHSKAKGVLTLVPLPRIDEIYARLKGSKVYSGFDA